MEEESYCSHADEIFNFNQTWWWVGMLISTICLSYMMIDYMVYFKHRPTPSRLMLIRAMFDYIAVVVVLYAIDSSHVTCDAYMANPSICQYWGALFLFCLYVPGIYYASICWQLYLTLKNPFRSPSDQSILFHFEVLLISFIVVFCVATIGNDGQGQFEYRPAFQICFLKRRVGLNLWNIAIIYVPTLVIVVGGIWANVWAIRQLKRRVVDDTFQLRWIAIKTQTAIITCFTINYFLQGINWTLIFDETEDIPKYDPYFLLIFCLLAVVFDAITWFVRNAVHSKYSHQDYTIPLEKDAKSKKVKINNLSDALRKEVITFITAGLAQSAMINSSKNCKRPRKRSIQSTENESLSTVTTATAGTDMMTNQLLHHLMEYKSEYKTIGNFSKIFNPNIKEDYFLMTREEEKSITRTADGDRELASVEQENYMATARAHKLPEEVLSDRYYPKKIDGKYKEHVIESYPIGSVGAEQTDVLFTDYAPVIFGFLRRNVFGVSDEQYKYSILPMDDVSKVSLELIAKFSEGRSGAFFFFTKDQKYLIKTLTKKEAQLLLNTLKKYCEYMSQNGETYLSKYFGLHAIKLYSHSIYFVVNKNVFPWHVMQRSPDETYDLKGSWIDRHTNHRVTDRKLMKDEDLHSRLVLNPQESVKIGAQLQLDTSFLSSLKIMDYSLLLGVYYTKVQRSGAYQSVISMNVFAGIHDGDIDGDEEDDFKVVERKESQSSRQLCGKEYSIYDSLYVEGPGRYCLGVIDMLQKWDTNKKGERFVKGLRGKDRNGISAVPPQQYQKRFMDKMQDIGIGKESQSSHRVEI